MKILPIAILTCVLVGAAQARESANRITPEMQTELDAQKRTVASWARNATIVSAIAAQNAKGPIPGMTNRAWKRLAPDDALVGSFQTNAAGKWLAGKLASSKGLYREAFVSAAQGEKVAFFAKPTRYVHKGEPKFDVPMKGSVWQGEPEFDKSSDSYVIQLAAPVIRDGKPIGVLVVGVSMKSLKTAAQ
jgi:hypothetical protein